MEMTPSERGKAKGPGENPDQGPAAREGGAEGVGGGGVGAEIIAAQDRFVAVWGQMGSAWGISRTMAEVHALLYITGVPLCTDDIMERLQISRGNASMSLRSLVDWGVVDRAHRRGDRKEYFKAEQDVWAMFRAIVRERMKREVDPTLAALYEIRDVTRRRGESGKSAVTTPEQAAELASHNQRLDNLLEFFQTAERLSGSFISPAGRGLQVAASLLRRAGEAASVLKGGGA